MKITIFSFELKMEWLLLIVIFISVLSSHIGKLLAPFFMCYLFILFHELSHIFVGSILDRQLQEVKMSLCGVCATFEKPKYVTMKVYDKSEYLKNIVIYLVGPLSNIILALIFRDNASIFQINMSLALLNLIPVYPLDGYQIFYHLLGLFEINNQKALTITKIINFFLLILLVIFACLVFILTMNPAMLIFVFYLFLLKKDKDKRDQLQHLITHLEYEKS